jgi:hypothetical protein
MNIFIDDSQSGDPSFSFITLLAHCDGANGSTTLTDNSPLAKTFTANGNAQISTAQSKFGGASALFDGAGDFFSTSYATSPIGTGDFTVEFWIRPLAIAADYNVFSVASGSNLNIFIGNDSANAGGAGIRFVIRNDAQGSNADMNINATLLAVGTWAHVACCAEGTAARLYFNGVQQLASSIVGSRTATFTTMNIGQLHASIPRYYNGYLDDIRVTKGVCRYPGGTPFTPPTAPFPNF